MTSSLRRHGWAPQRNHGKLRTSLSFPPIGTMKRFSIHVAVFWAVVSLSAWAASPAWAIYKIVGPDGTVTFSDTPPSSGQGKVSELAPGGGATPPAVDTLPQPLRDAVRKYPATLYTTPDCRGCDAGRQLLQDRGVPYTERTVTTAADMQAYRHVAGNDDRFPLLTLGGTRLAVGFNASSWSEALDAAGYPRHAELPRSYVQPQPSPLAPPKVTPARPASGSSDAGHRQPPVLPPPNPKAPPGFQF